jgi:RNA polymerase sigma-70 factor (ECF subfamily)
MHKDRAISAEYPERAAVPQFIGAFVTLLNFSCKKRQFLTSKKYVQGINAVMNHQNASETNNVGNSDTFQSLVQANKDKVLNTCYGFLKNREDAEDASQEVFIEVYRSLGEFREESTLSTWIYRIAVSKSLDILRKKNRKKRFDRLKRVLGFEQSVDHLPDKKQLNPEQHISAEERSQILHKAIETLSESQKVALTLSKLEGFSNAEVADIMDISLSSVESLIHRAKKKLYSKLYHYFKDRLF